MSLSFAQDKLWYKDAIFYEVYVRGFYDSNQDGNGDLAGLTSKLDYLQDLGVDCLWLMPIYLSPLKDDGYDISDFRRIHPTIGTVEDFEVLTRASHARGMRIIADLIVNHTSDQHPWFQEARRDPNSPKRDYYVWSDTDQKYSDARVIFFDTELSNWTWDPAAHQYYWHRFFSHEPDLNYDNPKVRQEMLDIMAFWLDRGIDGFRVNAASYLFEREGTSCENLPETHGFLKEMRRFVDERYPGTLLLAETNQWPSDLLPYFSDGNEFHMAFNFPLMPRLFMAVQREDQQPIVDIMSQMPEIPPTCQWATFLRNHGELTLEMVTDEERDYMYTEYAKDPRVRLNLGIRRRFAPLMDNSRRKMELLYSLLLTLPGSPVLYYGDEIGMGDNIYVGDRNGVRTPMQWSGDRNAGFSRADPSSLYQPINLDPIYNFQAVNVEAQLRSHSSLLNMLKDRNAQFENIARLKKRYLKRGLSVVSIDTKKKELLGEFYRDGVIDAQETIAVNDYDFGSAGSGVVIPHGIYDVGLNRGYVHLNTSHDTSELACDSLCPSLTPGGPAATSSKRSRSGCGPPGPALAGPGEWGYAPHTTGEACAREPWLTRARPGCGCWGRSWRIGCACAGGTPAAKSGRPAHATWARSSGTWTKRFPEERRARHTDCSTPVLVPGPASASPGGLSRMSAILQEEVHSVGGMTLLVKKLQNGQRLTVVVEVITGSDCILHWGLSRRAGGAWRRPPDACWPEGTTAFDGHAVRTPFSTNEKGAKEVEIHLDSPCPWGNLTFALYFPKEGRWVTSEGRDFSIPLPHGHDGASSPEEALAAWAPGESVVRQVFTLDGAERLAVATCAMPETVRVRMVCDAESPLALHWGVAWRFRHEGQLPPESFRPAGTSLFDGQAAHTPFTERDGLQYLELEFRKPAQGPGPRGMKFVLYQPDGAAWLKSGGKEVYCPLFEREGDPRLPSPRLWDLADQIVGAEKGASSWTLMHRFNLCHDLLEGVEDDEEALALLFAWLRYSATRQLDWQRHYNTQPRELSRAQERLTKRLAGIWRRQPPRDALGTGAGGRTWVRLLLTTLGRGGDGQQVRDAILRIMHRHDLKEVSGTFVEEWHQKLHNNTTPDDVVICTAYLAFLKSDGDLSRFYQTLEAGGVTRERLRGFERPIKADPGFSPDRKDALIQDFENFLRILKSVHSGTDLQSAADAARSRLGQGPNQQLDALFSLRQRGAATEELVPAATSAREGLREAIAAATDDAALRDLLLLDLALEGSLRGMIERSNLSQFDRDRLVELVHWALRNLNLSINSQELAICASHWAALIARPRDGRDWALHAKSVADRVARWVQGFTNDLYQRLQPKAEFLGEAFEVHGWAVPLFSEEVIRGGPAFALALLLGPLDPVLRKAAGLGGWQVISPARASGRVRLVDRLIAVQGERFPEPTVLVADAVSGNEEIPEGVTAVITSDAPDLLSHVAVRARNARVLFATCFDPEAYARLKGLRDKSALLRVTPGGDVEYEEPAAQAAGGGPDVKVERNTTRRGTAPTFSRWAVTQDQFTPATVGGKANNLNGLRDRLPDWVHLPTSLALPFGAFENALGDDSNRALRREYEALVAAAEQNPVEVLSRLRALLLEMAPPAELKESLLQAWQRVGLAPVPWEQAWRGIRRVWASKWNDRAYLSRRARGVPHEDLRMAVLIQQVVPADYAFVIHTANPFTGDPAELYAEVVLGMGETLVGNYPGRSLGFVCRKADLSLEVLAYPGKSIGLYGKGVIFRSDSNGEDLEDFAGAGLYDSFLAEEPEHRLLDYTAEKLVWDPRFRDDLLRSIARIGIDVEKVLGPAQDVEGAVAGGSLYVVQTRPQVGLGN